MPRDEFGIENPLDARTKSALLNEGAMFENLLDLAKQWELDHPLRPSAAPSRGRHQQTGEAGSAVSAW
jgi:hypothetical protein